MPAMIWGSTSQAFKEADTPKVWNESAQAFVDSEGKVYNGNEWVDVYGDKPATAIEVGQYYSFGPYEWICAEKFNSYAVLQSTGVTAGTWPGYKMTGPTSPSSGNWGSANAYYTSNIDGLNISGYDSTMSSLYSSISAAEYTSASYGKGLFLVSNSKAGQTTSGNQGSGNYWSALKTAATNHNSFGTNNSFAWLGTVSGSNGAWCVYSNGNVYGDNYQSGSYVVAPAFNLDLSKVKIKKDGTIVIK